MMLALLSVFSFFLSVLLAVPVLVYALECVMGCLEGRRRIPRLTGRPPVAVIIPAHDEETGIADTLLSIGGQLKANDRLIVVADNCRDDTAGIARALGAEVVERSDPILRGKGYALDAGLRHLRADPRPFVMIVDADCMADDDAVNWLAALSAARQRPVQGRNLMRAPAGAGVQMRVAEFAWVVKDLVRPTGLQRLRLACPLFGTGMMIPWAMASKINFAHGHVVEDMQLAFDLAQAGHAPLFCADFGITSYFPQTRAGVESQRRRWEGGHLQMIGAALRHLLQPQSIRTFAAFTLLLDRLVPPLTILLFLLVSACILSLPPALFGDWSASLLLACGNLGLFAAATGLVWMLRGRQILPPAMLGAIPAFIIRKLVSFPRVVLVGAERSWVRTDRRNAE